MKNTMLMQASGGGEIRSGFKSDSKSTSPKRKDQRYTLDPKELNPVFNTINEESKETINVNKPKKQKVKRDKPLKSKVIIPIAENEDKFKRKKRLSDKIEEKPKVQKAKIVKKVINKRNIKKAPKKNIIEETAPKKKYNKESIQEYMVKKNKEWVQKENQRYKDEEKKQQKVIKNLHKLASKRRKMLETISHSKSSLQINNYQNPDRTHLASAFPKNMSSLQNPSKSTLSQKHLKTQKKPRTKKIKQRVDSPSKILSSDSEFEEMSPQRYIDYCNLMSQVESEKAYKYRMMPLQRHSDAHESVRSNRLEED